MGGWPGGEGALSRGGEVSTCMAPAGFTRATRRQIASSRWNDARVARTCVCSRAHAYGPWAHEHDSRWTLGVEGWVDGWVDGQDGQDEQDGQDCCSAVSRHGGCVFCRRAHGQAWGLFGGTVWLGLFG